MKLAVIAEYDPNFEPHVQTDAAIAHSASALHMDVQHEWLSTSNEKTTGLNEFDALWQQANRSRSDGNIPRIRSRILGEVDRIHRINWIGTRRENNTTKIAKYTKKWREERIVEGAIDQLLWRRLTRCGPR